MNRKMNKLVLSILMACCLALIPFVSVVEAEQEGGQVSVPGTISFETEEATVSSAEKTKPSTTDEGQKKPAESTNKKYYSALPKTGESKSIVGISGLIFILGAGIIYYRRVGEQK